MKNEHFSTEKLLHAECILVLHALCSEHIKLRDRGSAIYIFFCLTIVSLLHLMHHMAFIIILERLHISKQDSPSRFVVKISLKYYMEIHTLGRGKSFYSQGLQ